MKKILLIPILLLIGITYGHGEMYKWVDEKGTVHFTDDLSNVPEKYLPKAEMRKVPQEVVLPGVKEKLPSLSTPKISDPEGFEVHLLRRGELWLAEVILNERVKRHLIVDTGASFTLINQEIRKDLGLTLNERTPYIPMATVSGVILTPLMTLRSMRVGNADVENVEAVVFNMPSGQDGLLGNSFLNKFKVVLDSAHAKMTLYSMQGVPSSDRPGGYSRDYWIGQFRFYHRILTELRKIKTDYGRPGTRFDLNKIHNAIQYFENQLGELERRASLAGVPRNWRE
jgi:clan AA aspartic protease (TIGR02281 family)